MGSLKRKWNRYKPLRKENALGIRTREMPREIVVIDPPGVAKMSEVFWEFIEPDIQSCASLEELHNMLVIAQGAWNAALMPLDERADYILGILKVVPPEGRPALAEVLAHLIRRKQEYYAHVDRMIVSFDLSKTPEGPHLTVMSSLERLH